MITRGQFGIIIAGVFTVFIAFGSRYTYGILLPQMLPDLMITKIEAGVIYSSYFLAYLICTPILGFMADRYNLRIILTLFTCILALGAFLMSLASTVINASLFFSVAGIGHSACWVPIVVLFQRWISDKHKGMALAVVDTGSAIGIITCSLLLPTIVSWSSWRTGWVLTGLFALLVAVINALFVRSYPVGYNPPQPQGNDKNKNILQTYLRLFHNPKLWLIGLSYLLGGGVCVNIMTTFLTSYAHQELMIPYHLSAGFSAIIAVTAILSKFIFGPLSDKLGRIKVMRCLMALIAISLSGIAFSRSEGVLTVFSILYGLGYGAVWPLYAAAASDYISKEYAGSVIGIWTLLLGIGAILGPVIAGWTVDNMGSYFWAFMLASSASLISLIFLLFVNPHLTEHPSKLPSINEK